MKSHPGALAGPPPTVIDTELPEGEQRGVHTADNVAIPPWTPIPGSGRQPGPPLLAGSGEFRPQMSAVVAELLRCTTGAPPPFGMTYGPCGFKVETEGPVAT